MELDIDLEKLFQNPPEKFLTRFWPDELMDYSMRRLAVLDEAEKATKTDKGALDG